MARSRRYWYAARHYRLGRRPKHVCRKDESFEPRRRAISEPPKRLRGCRTRGRKTVLRQEVAGLETAIVCPVPTTSEYRRKITTLLKKRSGYKEYFERNLCHLRVALCKVAMHRVVTEPMKICSYYSRIDCLRDMRKITRRMFQREPDGKAKEELKKYSVRCFEIGYRQLTVADRAELGAIVQKRTQKNLPPKKREAKAFRPRRKKPSLGKRMPVVYLLSSTKAKQKDGKSKGPTPKIKPARDAKFPPLPPQFRFPKKRRKTGG